MAFIDRKDTVALNVMLTSKGREEISKGNLTFKYLALGDSEIDYNFVNDINAQIVPEYNTDESSILKPKDKNPKLLSIIPKTGTTSGVTSGNTDGYIEIITGITTGTTATTALLIGTGYTATTTAVSLGFFDETVTTYLIDGLHVKQPDLMTYMSGLTGGDLLSLKKAPTFGTSGYNPAINDLLFIKYTHDGDTTGHTINKILPTAHLMYRIMGVTGNTTNDNIVVQVDRELPDFSLYSPTGVAGTLVYYSGLTYQHEYSVDYLSDEVLQFIVNYQYPIDIFPYWNMYIIFTEEVAGIQDGDKIFGQFKSRTVGGFVSYIQNQAPIYKKLGLIHYTNSSPANVYGEEFYLNTPTLEIPTIMWHKSSTRTLGATFKATGDVKILTGTTKSLDIQYYDLADANLNIIGKVFIGLKIFVIEDQEILNAMSYKSNRSWTLPDYDIGGFGGLKECPECPDCPPCPTTTLEPTTTTTLEPTTTSGLIQCDDSTSYSGGISYPTTQEVFLGQYGGTVTLDYNAIGIPDRFIVYFDGNLVIDTGYRGDSDYNYGESRRSQFNSYLTGKEDPILLLTYPQVGNPNFAPDGYPWIDGAPSGVANFYKNSITQTAIIMVYAPMRGTAWNYIMSCPDQPIIPTTTTSTTTLAPVPHSQIYFERVDRYSTEITGTLGINNDVGQTFTLGFEYNIIAIADNIGSDGLDANNNTTYLYVSVDDGSNWTLVDSIYAEVSGGNYPVAQEDYQSKTGTTTITGITDISLVKFRGVLGCDAGRAGKSGEVSVKIDTASVNLGITEIICNNGFTGSCFGGEGLYCNLTPTTTTTLEPTTTTTSTTTLAPVPTINTMYIHIPIT